MDGPVIPVSWGELLDKITILAIKAERLRSAPARANAARELALLRAVAGTADGVARETRGGETEGEVTEGGREPGLAEMEAGLLAVNTRLWAIEDRIREKEASGDFGPGFVALARAVYRENDERGRIKAAINRVLRSALVEEKQYSAY